MVGLYVIALLYKESEILLLRRFNASFGDGCYSLVGGKVEPKERVLGAIKREVFEEVGLEIDELKFNFIQAMHRNGLESEFVAIVFAVDISTMADPVNKEPHKHDDMKFFDVNALPENLLSAHREIIDNVITGTSYCESGWSDKN